MTDIQAIIRAARTSKTTVAILGTRDEQTEIGCAGNREQFVSELRASGATVTHGDEGRLLVSWAAPSETPPEGAS